MSLDEVAWPAARLGEALAALARAHRLIAVDAAAPSMEVGIIERGAEAQSGWLDAAAAALGLEVEAVGLAYRDLGESLRRVAPALLRLPSGGVLALHAVRGERVDLIGPDDLRARRSLGEIKAALAAPLVSGTVVAATDGVLARAGLTGRRAARARDGLLAQMLGARPALGITLIRARPGGSFYRALRAAGVVRSVVTFAVSQLVAQVVLLAGWWLLGRGALGGKLDRGWLAAWALLLFAGTLLRVVALAAQGRAAVGGGAVLRARLMAGALRLEPDVVRHEGAGHHLGRVLDADAVEALALGGGSAAFAAVLNLATTPLVLGAAAGGGALTLVYLIFAGITIATGVAYFRRRREQASAGLRVTHELVERLVGHRTRLIQEPRERWQEGIDHLLGVYLEAGRRLDGMTTRIYAVLPRAWLVAGVAALAPAFIGGAPLASLAVAAGGLLLGFRGLHGLGDGLAQLSGAAVAWRQVAPLYRAAAREAAPGAPALALLDPRSRPPLLEVRDIAFRHRGRAVPVLDGLDLTVAPGERLLLEGTSGGGKSTLASILAALRAPERGLVLLGGLDRASIGDDGWRRHVVNAPQFHENYIFAETLAFNVLLGRAGPPRPADLEEAETICRELGLGPLLERMPAGMMQMVGDMGWQLSHGERSRVYIARALLARAEMLILDESFAALDPETLGDVLKVVDRRAGTLLVIAHP